MASSLIPKAEQQQYSITKNAYFISYIDELDPMLIIIVFDCQFCINGFSFLSVSFCPAPPPSFSLSLSLSLALHPFCFYNSESSILSFFAFLGKKL